MYGMPEVGGLMPFGLLMMLAYALVGVGGFLLVAWGLLSVAERAAARRDHALDDLRRRYAGGEIDAGEFEARRRHLVER